MVLADSWHWHISSHCFWTQNDKFCWKFGTRIYSILFFHALRIAVSDALQQDQKFREVY